MLEHDVKHVDLARVLDGLPGRARGGDVLRGRDLLGHPGLEQTVRLEENLRVTKDAPVVFTKHAFDDTALS